MFRRVQFRESQTYLAAHRYRSLGMGKGPVIHLDQVDTLVPDLAPRVARVCHGNIKAPLRGVPGTVNIVFDPTRVKEAKIHQPIDGYMLGNRPGRQLIHL